MCIDAKESMRGDAAIIFVLGLFYLITANESLDNTTKILDIC